jgi:hypothetical protein
MQLDEIVGNLLEEFSIQREQIKEMVAEVEKLRSQVSQLFPDTVDARTRKFLEEKVKTMVGFYNVLLDMRKEITKSIKDELDVRRRMESDDFDPEHLEDLLDIGDLSRKVEKFQKQKIDLQSKRLERQKGMDELHEKGIEIPGMKELKETEGEI